MIKFKLVSKIDLATTDSVFLYGDDVPAKMLPFKKEEASYLQRRREEDKEALATVEHYGKDGSCATIYVQNFNVELAEGESQEKLRRAAARIVELQRAKWSRQEPTGHPLTVSGAGVIPEDMMAFLEGLVLSDYRFDKYKTKKEPWLSEVLVDARFLDAAELDNNVKLWRRICQCRDWVNEPVMYLNAETFATQLADEGKGAGVKVTVLGQRQIESLKMGGLLAVNRGSVDEARFVVMEYKPKKPVNAKPIALVGKGIMYDTGGLNIKPDDYMQEMKSDMAGAATMASVLFAAADNHLPVHLVALLPMTDNRPGFNAYAADDILTMYDGTTVEVVNTDAEGRLILADAIAYAARNYNPRLIIDAATLTGAAVRAISTFGIAAMQVEAENPMTLLSLVGRQVYERLVEFPMWSEYDELIKSPVADLRNCGTTPQAGTITAGKFLAHFAAKVPYIHLDIAGVAYFTKPQHYYRVGASGYGIRLLYAFLQMQDIINDK
jgi:leucyl aminopeptidase